MGDRIKKVTEFVEKHTDEQCGLDVANVGVFDNYGNGPITIVVGSKSKKSNHKVKNPNHKGMRSEWLMQANDLIEEIGHDPRAGYGGLGIVFELQSVSNRSFMLTEKEE